LTGRLLLKEARSYRLFKHKKEVGGKLRVGIPNGFEGGSKGGIKLYCRKASKRGDFANPASPYDSQDFGEGGGRWGTN